MIYPSSEGRSDLRESGIRVAAEPAPVGGGHLAELGALFEDNVGERQLEASAISLAHGDQAPPRVRPAVDSHDPDLDPSYRRDLRDIPGLTVVAEPGGAGRRVDAILRVADREEPIAVEFKRRVNAATARQFVHQSETLAEAPLLMVAGETTVEARAILEEQGIGVIDGLGTACLGLVNLDVEEKARTERDKQSLKDAIGALQ